MRDTAVDLDDVDPAAHAADVDRTRSAPAPADDSATVDAPAFVVTDGVHNTTLRLEPDGFGSLTAYATVGYPSGVGQEQVIVSLPVELTPDDVLRLHDTLVGPTALYLRAEDARYQEQRAADDERAEQEQARLPFVIRTLFYGPAKHVSSTETVHTRHCSVTADHVPANRGGQTVSNAEDTQKVVDRFVQQRLRSHLGQANLEHREAQAARGTTPVDFRPLRFCERCRPLGSDTRRINLLITRLASAASTDGQRLAPLEDLARDISTQLWQSSQRHLASLS